MNKGVETCLMNKYFLALSQRLRIAAQPSLRLVDHLISLPQSFLNSGPEFKKMVRTQAAATNRPRAKLEPFYKLITFFLGMSSIVVLNLLYRTFVLDSAKVVKEIVRTNHSASFRASNTSEANFNGILEVIFLST